MLLTNKQETFFETQCSLYAGLYVMYLRVKRQNGSWNVYDYGDCNVKQSVNKRNANMLV